MSSFLRRIYLGFRPMKMVVHCSWCHGPVPLQPPARRISPLSPVRCALVHEAAAAGAGAAARGRIEDCTYGGHNARWLSRELPRLVSMQKKPGDGLVLTRGAWSWDVREHCHYQFRGLMRFFNITARQELFIPEVQGKVQLLSLGSIASIRTNVQILPKHPRDKLPSRDDHYWSAYITCAGESTSMEVVIDIQSDDAVLLGKLQAVRISIEYICYGPHGRTPHAQHVILPTFYPELLQHKASQTIQPISTHLLCHLDDPFEVLKTYVLPHVKVGDVIAIGETPLAIMQGRYRHPASVRPGLVARLACRLFLPTSSLATACGMQALIDISGKMRVIFAVLVAVFARLVGVRGMFYRLAGEQAKLIDDVTGTLPPYDQYITLGPVHVQATVDALKAKTGCDVAVVDVNDLKSVQILAASDGVDHSALSSALINNPAGNSDEQTPIVLVRRS